MCLPQLISFQCHYDTKAYMFSQFLLPHTLVFTEAENGIDGAESPPELMCFIKVYIYVWSITLGKNILISKLLLVIPPFCS